MKKLYFVLSAVAVSVFASSCFTNPVTGRKSLNLTEESDVTKMATAQYNSFLAANPPVNGTGDADMVKRIGSKMSAAVQQYLASKGEQSLVSSYQWEFNLVNNGQANAWCMPGGKVVVYSGILPLTQTEAGLAVVMGHEIAHAVARHGNERMSAQLLADYGGQTLSALMASNSDGAQKVFGTVYGLGAAGTVLAYSRKQESEADEMGLYFTALAGYDPNEAISFWQRMAAKGKTKLPEFLSTHPADGRRINDLKKWMPRAMEYYTAKK